tara:strand:+ start:216 stop:473 length:258 start_codon:yes stop_codon:yes gene_type:complete
MNMETPEIIDIVDNETGEIYEEDMLLAVAYLWSAQRGFRVVKIEEDFFDGTTPGGLCLEPKVCHWLYVEPKKGPEGDTAREMQYC